MRSSAPAAAGRLAALPPSSFAFVMATGIVALAARQQGFARLAQALFAAAAVGWCGLWLLTLLRLLRHADRAWQDLCDHLRGPGYFTLVAGTSVLAAECLAFQVGFAAGAMLGALALLLWFLVNYGLLAVLITRSDKPALADGIGGGWLLAVVACQSLVVVAALLSGELEQPWRLRLNFGALALWLFAGVLYTWLVVLIFYRYLFLRFAPGDLSPPSWINMGAMAISTLAGTELVANAPQAPLLHALLPFLQGFTILYWACATWWLPLLLALLGWRYLWRRDPARSAFDWSAVFPLGMYAAATHQMMAVLPVNFLAGVDTLFFWLALLAWVGTAALRLRDLWPRWSGLVRQR
jgi:tellurite resistance protein TehA-like permease